MDAVTQKAHTERGNTPTNSDQPQAVGARPLRLSFLGSRRHAWFHFAIAPITVEVCFLRELAFHGNPRSILAKTLIVQQMVERHTRVALRRDMLRRVHSWQRHFDQMSLI